jgi:flagellar biosynthesis GTPase FlhF
MKEVSPRSGKEQSALYNHSAESDLAEAIIPAISHNRQISKESAVKKSSAEGKLAKATGELSSKEKLLNAAQKEEKIRENILDETTAEVKDSNREVEHAKSEAKDKKSKVTTLLKEELATLLEPELDGLPHEFCIGFGTKLDTFLRKNIDILENFASAMLEAELKAKLLKGEKRSAETKRATALREAHWLAVGPTDGCSQQVDEQGLLAELHTYASDEPIADWGGTENLDKDGNLVLDKLDKGGKVTFKKFRIWCGLYPALT